MEAFKKLEDLIKEIDHFLLYYEELEFMSDDNEEFNILMVEEKQCHFMNTNV